MELFALASAQHGAFTFDQACTAGCPTHVLRRLVATGVVARVAPSTYVVTGSADTWERHLSTAVLRSGGVAGHRSAAALWHFPGFPPVPIEIVRVRGGTTRDQVGHLRQSVDLPTGDTTTCAGIPVTTVARTLIDLAGIVHVARLARVVDAALARRLVNLEVLRERAEAHGGRGRAGTVAMRAVLAERSEGHVAPESELEAELFELLQRSGLPLPVRQRSVGGTRAPIGRVDFVYLRERLVVEADGRTHHTALSDWESDRRRDLLLVEAGWRVVRVTWRQVKDEPVLVVGAIRVALGR